jgi:serine/threonine protein kinase
MVRENAVYVDALTPGTKVGEFEIIDVVGQGGFGIVYTANHPLFGVVALKEFFPKSQASRAHSGDIVPSSPAKVEAFRKGVQKLITEGKKLQSLQHPGIVRVFGAFESHGSAYLIMTKITGPSLDHAVESKVATPTPAMVKDFLEQTMEALAAVHQIGLVHRDVAPDNILVEQVAGRPRYVLIDFGGAKKVVTDESHSSTDAITKRGFSPPEQYAAEGSAGIRATPSTDIYALCATVYWLLTGKRPLEAPVRSPVDSLVPLARNANLVSHYDPNWLAAIDKGMSLAPSQRFPSVSALQAALAGAKAPARPGKRLIPAIAIVGVLAVLVAVGKAFWPASEPQVVPQDPAAATAVAGVATSNANPQPIAGPDVISSPPQVSTYVLTITTDPADAEVTIDGSSFQSGASYPSGSHEIAVSKFCFQSTTAAIDLQADSARDFALKKRTHMVLKPGPEKCTTEVVQPARPAKPESEDLESEETVDGALGTSKSTVCIRAKSKARRALDAQCDDELRSVHVECECVSSTPQCAGDAFGNWHCLDSSSCTATGSATCKSETAAVAEVTEPKCEPTQVETEECY